MLAVRKNRYVILPKDFEKAYKNVIRKTVRGCWAASACGLAWGASEPRPGGACADALPPPCSALLRPRACPAERQLRVLQVASCSWSPWICGAFVGSPRRRPQPRSRLQRRAAGWVPPGVIQRATGLHPGHTLAPCTDPVTPARAGPRVGRVGARPRRLCRRLGPAWTTCQGRFVRASGRLVRASRLFRNTADSQSRSGLLDRLSHLTKPCERQTGSPRPSRSSWCPGSARSDLVEAVLWCAQAAGERSVVCGRQARPVSTTPAVTMQMHRRASRHARSPPVAGWSVDKRDAWRRRFTQGPARPPARPSSHAAAMAGELRRPQRPQRRRPGVGQPLPPAAPCRRRPPHCPPLLRLPTWAAQWTGPWRSPATP